MNESNWEVEQQRFMDVAYDRAHAGGEASILGLAPQQARGRPGGIHGQSVGSVVAALGAGQRSRTAALSLAPLGEEWVQYDRRIAGRPRNLDIQDYRAGMVQHLMDGRGKLQPHDRSDRTNGFLDWTGAARTDDPCRPRRSPRNQTESPWLNAATSETTTDTPDPPVEINNPSTGVQKWN